MKSHGLLLIFIKTPNYKEYSYCTLPDVSHHINVKKCMSKMLSLIFHIFSKLDFCSKEHKTNNDNELISFHVILKNE